MMSSDLAPMVDLRLRTAPGDSPDIEAARAFLSKAYKPLLTVARRLERLERDGQWVGAVLYTEPGAGRFGVPEASVVVLVDPQFPDVRTWADSTLRRLGPELDAHCTLELTAQDHGLVGTAEELGFGCTKVDLVGTVTQALERLRGRAVDPADRGVVFEASKVEQAAAINALARDFFIAHPEFGWGGPKPGKEAQEAIDQRQISAMEERLSMGLDSDFLICRDGQILGTFWFETRMSHPLMGDCGGLNIILLPEIQGQGLGKAAYLHMLERMDRQGVETLFGRTSNPGVIWIAQAMGRRLRRIILRRDGPFISADWIEKLVG